MKQFKVKGMMCAACSARVEKAVSSLEGVRECSVNLLAGSMNVESSLEDKAIIDAVKRAGYSAKAFEGGIRDESEERERSAERKVLLRLTASLCLLLPLMYISMGYVMMSAPMFGFFDENPIAVAVTELALSAAVLVINKKFFINGFKGVISLAPNMDTLVAMGSGISFLYSLVVILIEIFAYKGQSDAHYLHDLYFESAAMIVTLITVGKLLEERAKGKTTNAVKALMDLSPKKAVIIKDGAECEVATSQISLGDIFVLRAGSAVPVDGVVIEGEASITQSALTGESVPVDKSLGDDVYAATVCSSGYIKCRAVSVGENTKISGVIKLVEEASSTKAPISKVADRVSGVFVPTILGISLLTFAMWWIFSGNIGTALTHGIAVMVISCPCALGLATPVAIMVGSGVGAKLGVLFKSAEAIELTARASVVAVDKTGTVTEGTPEVVSLHPAQGITEERLLSAAYSLEDKSEHPQGRAIVRFCEGRVKKLDAENVETFSGNGIKARIMQTIIYGGSIKFIKSVAKADAETLEIADRLSEEGKTPLLFAEGDRCIGIIATADRVREDSAEAILEMKKMGLSVVMLTGDNRKVAESIASKLSLDGIISDVLPDGKAKAIEGLGKKGKVIMIGDGINDAPALTASEVGMAIGGGTDIAIESADVVLVRNSLKDAVLAIRLGRKVLRNIHENLFFAFFYNLIGIPMAAGLFGFTLPPMFGALAMSLSSFSVVSNALRLNRFNQR